jgi:hypothetical protein
MEYAALVVSVVQLSAVRGLSVASPKKNRCGSEHADGRHDEVDPESVPVTSVSCGTKGSRWVPAHPERGVSNVMFTT